MLSLMVQSGALPGLLGVALLAGCAGDAQSGALEPGAMSQQGSEGTTSGEASGVVGGSVDRAPPETCRQPAPPQLCLLVPEPVGTALDLGQGLYGFTQKLSAEVAALEPGPLEQALYTYGCSIGNGEPSAPDTQLEWLRLEVGAGSGMGTAWLALSAPPGGLPVEAGDSVEVEYTQVDDQLMDFGPKTISLVLRDSSGEPLAWVATSDSVASLGEHAPPGVTLRQGAAQCETADNCQRFEQHELNVGIGSRELVLAQGELASESGWQVLAGRAEVVTGEMGGCSIDGYPQLASVALWRSPE
jgi:hypothetical protein